MAEYNDSWPQVARAVKEEAGWCCEACGHPHQPETGYTLTVHHIDGNSRNDEAWNLAALCQRCHLRAAGHVSLAQLLFDFMWPDYWLCRHIKEYKTANAA